MGERTSYEPGTFCWAELATTDTAAAKTFYGELFGWVPEDLPVGDGMTYTMLRLEGDDVAALYEPQTDGQPPLWVSYVSVEDADATAARAGDVGGTVVSEPFDVMDSGRMAVLQDPAGAVLAAWQPGQHVGARRVNEPRCLSWNELAVPDIAAVEGYYAGLFEWSVVRVPTPPDAPAIGAIANRVGWRNGNIRATTDQPAAWTPYFGVESCDEVVQRIAELGGATLFGPIAVPAGKMAVVADPQGAAFGLVEGQFDP
jgi:predicted enzyme related to lactoylglutathione lyase